MGRPHVLALPYPAQGHVIPLMEVARRLANNGIRVTFVNTDFNHERVMKALSRENVHELISLVSIPDGIQTMEERMDHGKLAESISENMPGELEALIVKLNTTESDEIICVIGDLYMAFAMEVAKKFGIKRATFNPASAAMLGLTIGADKLIDDGIVDSNGTPLVLNQVIQLAPSMPEMISTNLAWCLPDFRVQQMVFNSLIENNKLIKLAQRLISNTSPELEPGSLAFLPDCIPIGPLLALENSSGNFWPEDSTSLDWLDQQPANSVIYVAFGSYTIFDQTQFQELAMALELTNRPFLWVVRQDITQDIDQAYPIGFMERVKNRGKIVGWAPQQRVLSHSSVACFLSHCGWNSTIEGVTNGVPFLCWPYFADQFINETYVCDHWGVGLGLEKDEGGIIRCDEIENKVEKLLSDGGFRTRSLELQGKILDSVKGGQKNFHEFVDWIKGN